MWGEGGDETTICCVEMFFEDVHCSCVGARTGPQTGLRVRSHCRKAVYVRVSPAIEISSGAICKVKRNNMKKTTCTLRPLSRLAKILGYGRVCQNSMARASRLSKRYLMSLGASTLVPAAWTGV